MKIAFFLLFAAPVLFCTNSVQAYRHHDHFDRDEPYEALKRNSIYRDNEQVLIRAHSDHRVYKNLEKERSTVLVKDANGNIQESTRVYIFKNKKD